ncbi:hypothetical protein M5X00_29520 [Paenibacillus alvei]|uniref:hypothetical protein n=1 Tax=Paenibacillus alvei TaxID=44250 RepID=UPI00031B140E|nr:hypothetical protein [Paenibacillus alvei]MCY9707617.1 hypothetical protein [Paenibacillus alvei]MCY9758360.1 hypothetical protein [Paenibacillus alvei]MEC0082871.1 hypothetical protein [Paenibacillus alvei]
MSENPQNMFVRDSVVLDYAKLTELVIKDLSKNTSSTTKTYSKNNVSTWLGNPKRYSKELQGMSAFLYDVSPHYRRLVNYYAKMPTLDYYVELYGLDTSKSVNEKTLRSNYLKALDFVELMNVRHEFGKALVSAWKLGTFYGFELYTKDSYFIKELPFEFCQISGIADGVYTFNFDCSFFDKNPVELDLYPPEFKKMFNSYKAGKPKWQEVDPARSICIKVNEETYYDMPPFAGLFGDIFDIEDYKALRMASAVIGNYKFIIEKIPLRDSSDKNNDFMVDLKTVSMFHNKTASLLPDEIGIFSTPFEIDTVEFSKDKSEVDNVSNSENAFYTAAGTAKQLFNPDSNSSATLAKSINVDESEVFGVLRQLERIGTGKLKNEISGSFKFRLKILDNTIFNKKENAETLLKNAQYGLPVKLMLCACLGVSPSAVISMNFLEEQVLGLTSNFIPLSSSHTQSGGQDDQGGRPPMKDDQLTAKGEAQRDGSHNDNANA